MIEPAEIFDVAVEFLQNVYMDLEQVLSKLGPLID